ncbi:MAG TPA: RsmE family RNA methyltransferase [Candidatus Omnitrophota bacterium]|nr:RsmE family RNA methyltransferase [Candidatus Omnitrophota bacterium]HPT39439.1 RsmE family RNA methyltransferase [Candidatus Omnitrophota bacterium]
MNRFFVEKINALDKDIVLNDLAQLHHLRDVLRVKLGEKVAVFDRLGNEYLAQVSEIQTASVKFEIKEKRPFNKLDIQITVACAIPKKVKMDDIIDKLTQLGVACIIPLQTERVVVKLDKQKKLQRFQRWEKIALSAVKQSQRSDFVVIKPVTDFKNAISDPGDFDLKLIPTLEAEGKSLKSIFDLSTKPVKKIIVFIGPEGDFTPQEVALACAEGFLPVTLGKQVLRVDTAAIAAVSFIKLNAED